MIHLIKKNERTYVCMTPKYQTKSVNEKIHKLKSTIPIKIIPSQFINII